jgi:hypothetical protein
MRRSSFECDLKVSLWARNSACFETIIRITSIPETNICLLPDGATNAHAPSSQTARPPAEECGDESDMLSSPFVLRSSNTGTRYQLCHSLRYRFPLGSVSQLVYCGVNLVSSLFKARRICRAFVFLSMLLLLR